MPPAGGPPAGALTHDAPRAALAGMERSQDKVQESQGYPCSKSHSPSGKDCRMVSGPEAWMQRAQGTPVRRGSGPAWVRSPDRPALRPKVECAQCQPRPQLHTAAWPHGSHQRLPDVCSSVPHPLQYPEQYIKPDLHKGGTEFPQEQFLSGKLVTSHKLNATL